MNSSSNLFSADSSKRTALAVILLVLAMVFCLGACSLHAPSETNSTNTANLSSSDGMYAEKLSANVEETEMPKETVKPEEPVDKNTSSISIPGYDRLTFKANGKQQDVQFFNPEVNNCLFQMSLVLEDGTVLWKSDLIEPGTEINQIGLERALEQGTYSATVCYECYSLEEHAQLNGAEIGIELVVC